MLNYQIDMMELRELRDAHRRASHAREARRNEAVVLLGGGWKPLDVARVLLSDEDSLRAYFKRYKKGEPRELLRMSYVGGEALLDDNQLSELARHLHEKLHPTAKSVVRWVVGRCGVRYTESGMTTVLHRLGYGCTNTQRVPGKANRAKREASLADYRRAMIAQAKRGDPSCFMAAVHPQPNPVAACAWIKRSEDRSSSGNTGGRCLTANGAMKVCKLPETSRIQREFFPVYSQTFNLIERLWTDFKSRARYNRHYDTIDHFRGSCAVFLNDLKSHIPRLPSLLVENLAIIGK